MVLFPVLLILRCCSTEIANAGYFMCNNVMLDGKWDWEPNHFELLQPISFFFHGANTAAMAKLKALDRTILSSL